MPSLNNKALLLELTAFASDNNIRRGVLTMATNTQAVDGVLNDRSLLVQLNLATPIVIGCVAGNQTTVLKSSGGPIHVSAKIGSNITATEFDVASLWVMTSPVTELSVSNLGTRPVQLRIIQV